jgi:hypothetical protein
MWTCVSEGCGRKSYTNKFCQRCRRHANKDKACATEGCKRKPGISKRCHMCRLPACAKRCNNCDMEAWHHGGSSTCYKCQTWNSIKTRGVDVSFTRFEFMRLLHEADICPDTGLTFDDCSPDRMLRKSPDRIDNSKGYEPGNVRVTTWRANNDRRSTPIDEWLPIAAVRYKTNSKTLTSN